MPEKWWKKQQQHKAESAPAEAPEAVAEHAVPDAPAPEVLAPVVSVPVAAQPVETSTHDIVVELRNTLTYLKTSSNADFGETLVAKAIKRFEPLIAELERRL